MDALLNPRIAPNGVLSDTRFFWRSDGDEPANVLFVVVDGQVEMWIVQYDTWRDAGWSVQRVLELDRLDIGVDVDNDCDSHSPVVARMADPRNIRLWIEKLLWGLSFAEELLRGCRKCGTSHSGRGADPQVCLACEQSAAVDRIGELKREAQGG